MLTLDALLARIDADLALPMFPPLQACPPRPAEPPMRATGGLVSPGVTVRLGRPAPFVIPPLAERLAAQQARDAELTVPRAQWWKRVFRRG